MTLTPDTVLLVIDVESIGLHGEPFAVAGALYRASDGSLIQEFHHACPPLSAKGDNDDWEWIAANVPPLPARHAWPEDIMDAFWRDWTAIFERHIHVAVFAECLWPVEARFLCGVIDRNPDARKWRGPYPFHDIASVMLAAGMDPMREYVRTPDELPKHDPRADVRQSARLLFTALSKLGLYPPSATTNES